MVDFADYVREKINDTTFFENEFSVSNTITDINFERLWKGISQIIIFSINNDIKICICISY